MGKRSDFKRVERDYYPTPFHACEALFPHLPEGSTFIEPCAGDGRLINHLESQGHKCVFALDMEPQRDGIAKGDALEWVYTDEADYIITNPPWDRKMLHPMIENFKIIAPTWLLFDADWIHTQQAARFMPNLRKIVSIGRVKWFNNQTGKDNACWYLFDNNEGPTTFHGRIGKG